MKNKARVIMFEKCNRKCAGCCNNDFDIGGLPRIESYKGWDEIILTGGEPMLDKNLVISTAMDIRRANPLTTIILYTAKSKRATDLLDVLFFVDGLTLTLHENFDVPSFNQFNTLLHMYPALHKSTSLRLNVFKGIKMNATDTRLWKVKYDIEWLKNCPLPEGEVLLRL